MPLSTADFAALGDTPITILSTAFPNVYLRLDGFGVTTSTDSGSGTVNCQYGVGTHEKYLLRAQPEGLFSFESATFPNVYLRADGTGVTVTGPGGGTVNCQYGAGPYEKYKLRAQADGSFSFELATFPNVYLRLVAHGVTAFAGSGSGIVNCQFNANGGGHEKFLLNVA
ncbi:hypothetical protein AWW66_03615 [Micromonospora rosaria]|uniref:Uncharacterized protein n=1 Tax=Micromonospora rosaria TaxID=47874 RepID=A0A136PY54_9ACTN|nr:hypothetical protein [Micromonospora rosaria]KXK63410.1 hypothetical protein AWW66_03615 [Micromonospora rosaria]